MPDAPVLPAPAPPSKLATLVRRFSSTVVLWTVVLASLFSEHKIIADYLFLGFMVALAWLGLREFYNLVEKRGLVCFDHSGIAVGVLMIASTFFYVQRVYGRYGHAAKANDFETGILVIFVLGLCVRQFVSKRNTEGIVAISTTLFGLMYVPWLLNFIQKIKFFPLVNGVEFSGSLYVFYFILVTKFSDMGAYVTGSLIGRHKMIPRISPAKTWEGFGGAIVFSVGGSLAFAHFAGKNLAGMTLVHAAILGVILSVSAVVGDLIESLFKREAGVKDSGKFFPGIGGVLDLLDSILFNAPLMYLYLRHVLMR
ncbi:MAG: phosphatidate cytidylyltransferase [Verrucomicrobia bacterium]|nr:phosphatidate cytidylyltransferase [Verrucomicrobiota bacterium]